MYKRSWMLLTCSCLLRRYDTIKSCRWHFFKFSWVILCRKICNGQKRSKDQKYYKIWTKETVFVYITDFVFYGISLAKTDFFKKYVILCEFMRKNGLNVHVFQNKSWCNPKSDRLFFSNFDWQRTFP